MCARVLLLIASAAIPLLHLTFPAAPAQAAPASLAGAAAPVPEADIVVTVRRREETSPRAPVSFTVIDRRTLDDLLVDDIRSAIALTPNAVIQRDPENFNTYINIRGIRQADVNAEPNFGLFRDGIFYGGQRSNLGPLVDVARIEVLRGPQSGLFGRNALGGAVNIVYALPTEEQAGYAALGYGRHRRLELEGAFNLLLGENVALRATGWLFGQRGGEFYNVALGKEIDRGRDSGFRLTARVRPDDRLEMIWTAEYQRTVGPSARTYAPSGVTAPGIGAPVVGEPETPRTVRRDTDGRARHRQVYLSQIVNREIDLGTLSLLAAFRDYRLDGVQDLDSTAFEPSDAPGFLKQVLHRDERIRSLYVEALWRSPDSAGPFRWMAGVSAFRETFDIGRTFETSIDLDHLGIPIGVVTGRGGQPAPGSAISTRALSAFAELGYTIAPSLTVTGDLRYSRDGKRLNYTQGILPFDPATDPILAVLFAQALPGFSLDAESTFDNWSPSMNVGYSLTPEVDVYATYSTGFRAGGFNTTSSSPEFIPYGQEGASSYELGARSSWFGRRLRVSAALFYMTQTDLLLAQDDPGDHLFGFAYLRNIGNARTWGAELEMRGRPAPWLRTALSIGHLDAKFTSGSSFGMSVAGDPIPYTRSWTLNGLVDVAYPIGPGEKLVGTVSWRVEMGGVLDRGAPYDDLSKLDLTLGVEHEGVRLVAYIVNLFNDRVVEFRYQNGLQSLSQGRTYGVEARLRF